MIILGMTGPIGHGKSTFADALAALVPRTVHFEGSLIIAEVANELHRSLRELPDPYDVDSLNNWLKELPLILQNTVHSSAVFEQIELHANEIERHPIEYQKLILHVENLHRNPKLARQDITNENKEAYRPLLQWLGGYLVQTVDAGLWYKEIVKRIGVVERQGCDLCIVGGLRFPTDARILREAGAIIVKVYRPGHLQNDMLDPTERERENIKTDCTIMSNGTMEDISQLAKIFMNDIRTNNLQKLYQTKDMAVALPA